MRDAAVLVVNYRSAERSIRRVAELAALAAAPREVVIVDNSPEEGLGARLTRGGAATLHVPMPRNVGFAAAVNEGLRRTQAEIVVLLNPDAVPEPGCLEGLVRVVGSDPEVAAAAPRLLPLSAAGPERPSALRRDPDLWTALVEYTSFARLAPRGWLEHAYFLTPEGGAPTDCAMVQGACMALARRFVEQVGGFDERFFLYWEETDWCRRARAAGGRIVYCPGLLCRHEGGASSESPASAARHFWNGFRAYHRKHGGARRALALEALVPAGAAAEYAILTALHVARRGRDAKLADDRRRLRERLAGL